MKKLLMVAASLCVQATLFAQTPSPAPSPNDVETLRQQVEALTATVKALQEQVKAQQETLAKMNAGPTTLPAAETPAASPEPAASAPPLFPNGGRIGRRDDRATVAHSRDVRSAARRAGE